MTEIGLIREQLASELTHLRAVANVLARALERATPAELASGAPLGEFRQACVDYLVRSFACFEERDQRLNDLLEARFPKDDPARVALDESLGRRGRSREALEKLETALSAAGAKGGSAGSAWAQFAEFFNKIWGARREAIDALLATNSRTSDWRAIGGIDADAILEERQRYARVRAALPAGLVLERPPRS